jgi:hypothetical protein
LYKLNPENLTLTKNGDTYTVTNNGTVPAVQVRLVPGKLPAFVSDNYFALMPGESRTVTSTAALSL